MSTDVRNIVVEVIKVICVERSISKPAYQEDGYFADDKHTHDGHSSFSNPLVFG
jgi:hypothetical protein